MSWGLSRVTLGVIVRFSFRPNHSYHLPLLVRLYPNKAAAANSRRAHRSRPELASCVGAPLAHFSSVAP